MNGSMPTSAKDLDRLYDNRALVPEHPKHFADWAATSRAVRDTARCALDLSYGDDLRDSAETLDIFFADAGVNDGRAAPVLVFMHGGYWRSLDKSDHSFLAPAFARLGVCVVVVNYALCPGKPGHPVRIPDITLQMTKAMAWLYHSISQFGGDANRMVVAGHSAGGQLAAMMLLCDWPKVDASLPRHMVRQAVSISGVFDLMPLMRAPSFQASLKLDPDQINKASPARLPAPIAGRLRALVGGAESAEFLRQNSLIQTVWGQAAVPVCSVLEGLNHFSILDSMANPDSALFAAIMHALEATHP
jgi:arylformamidase